MSATDAATLQGLERRLAAARAVDGVDLSMADGEFFSLLGPSGFGKITCLRLIAGFEEPSAGTVRIFGESMDARPPFTRDVNTFFRDYAFFSHLTVVQNIGCGLRLKRVGKVENRKRVGDILDLVHLPDIAERRPHQRSRGQKQRVALARALVNRPRILLLDEPLGALDLMLRRAMQVELKAIQEQVGITFVYVTHDQEEAISMSDRLAIFNRGKIEQVGTPSAVYEYPETSFVADFVGLSNRVGSELASRLGLVGAELRIVRPEKVLIHRGAPPADHVATQGRVTAAVFLGMVTRFRVEVGEAELESVIQNTEPHDFAVGEDVQISFHPRDVRVLRA